MRVGISSGFTYTEQSTYPDASRWILGLRAASNRPGMKACSASRPSTRRTSARLRVTAYSGFIGTAWMSSTPVARLCTSTRSPPMWRATSARSGIDATTRRTPSAGARAATSTANAAPVRRKGRFMKNSSSVAEAVHVASDDGRPLQEELTLVVLRRIEVLVLEADALKLRGPNGQVRRVGQRCGRLAVQ